jgi:hypothetical protein
MVAMMVKDLKEWSCDTGDFDAMLESDRMIDRESYL